MEKTLKLNDIIKYKVARLLFRLGAKRHNRLLMGLSNKLKGQIAKKYRCLGSYAINIENKTLYDFS